MREVARDWRKLLSLLLVIALLLQVSPVQAFADQQESVKAGERTLVTNSYAANNGLLEKQTYGNGFVVGHEYDSLDRESVRSYNNDKKFYWTYNADGNLARYSENGNRVLTYRYDDIGRLLQVSGDDGSYIKTSYDNVDKSTQLHYKVNGQRRDVYFGYSTRDNLPLTVRFGADSAYVVENNYDELTRLKFKTYTLPSSGTKINTSYSYLDWTSDTNRTTGTVRGIDYTFTSGGLTTYDRWYTYDKAGNILSECSWESSTSKPVKESYTYDSKNQLVRHDSVTQGYTIEYSYDTAGNITAKNTYAYTQGDLTGVTPTKTVTYGYDDSSWHDLLTSYDGQAIEYDAIGNPTIYRGWTMEWEGRQLKSAGKNGTNLSFTYDSEGIRTSKTVGSTTTKYLLNGTQILAQTTNGKTLCFFYDQQGSRVAMADSSNHIYYYLYNLQGDVIALADAATGKLAATYTYDAWGRIVKINNQNPEAVAETSIAKINPFRYRGYYYDSETGLYYLQSRYYDAETGRFINADAFATTDITTPLSTNMFAYCENNPVMKQDPTGELGVIASCLVGGAVSVITSFIGAKVTGQDFTLEDAAISFALGSISYSPLKVLSKAIPALASFANTYSSVKESGATTADAIGCGMLAAGLGLSAPSNLKCLGSGNVGTKAVLDLTFGTAGSLFSNYATKSAKDKGKKNNKKQIIASNQSRWDNMTQHYRGQVIKH